MTIEERKTGTQGAETGASAQPPSRGLSRRDILTGAGLDASGMVVAGATHFANNMPDWAVQRLIDRNIGARQSSNHFKEDALHVVTTGTGAPLPDPKRVGPQTVVVAGGQMLIFDTGPGSTRKLGLTGLDISSAKALFLTHFHSDHISDLGELMLQHWAGTGVSEPLRIFGPPGVEEVVSGFLTAYRLDRSYRIAHHGPEAMPRPALAALRRLSIWAPTSCRAQWCTNRATSGSSPSMSIIHRWCLRSASG